MSYFPLGKRYLYKSTKSTALISGVFISQLLPAFLILVIGRTIDIFDKKKLIILCKACRIILFFVLLVNRSTITIYIVSFLLSFILEYSSNIFNALMTDLFTKEELLNKSSIISTANSVSMIAGPLLASVLTYKTSLNVTISINIVLCMVVTVLYCGLKVERTLYSDGLTRIGERYKKRNIVKAKIHIQLFSSNCQYQLHYEPYLINHMHFHCISQDKK